MAMVQKKKKSKIQQSDPGKLLDLIMSLTDEKCVDLQIKVNSYLREECEADLAFIVIVQRERNEAFLQAVDKTALPRLMTINLSQKFLETLKTNLDQSDLLTNFDQDFQALVTPHLPKDGAKKRITLYPIVDSPFSIVFCVVAPKIQEGTVPMIIYECGIFIWPTLKKTIALEYECTLKTKCQQLLRAAKRLFTQVASLETLLEFASEQAKQLTRAEYCNVMLVDVERMELYDTCLPIKTMETKRRFPLNIGIAGEVVKKGTLINARVAEKHPSYNPRIDSLPNIKSKNLLCFPIREQTGIIGVGQLFNKKTDPYFDGTDEEMALAFSIYCGVCIIHSVIYQRIQEAHIRNALANELVMYHMKVTDEEVARLLNCTGFHKHPHLNSLHFNPRALPLRELPCYCVQMMLELGFDRKFNIRKQKLATFILYVKKGYRDVPYHNWMHAFNVGQWAYAAVLNYRLVSQGYFSDLQALMFVIAGFLHDIDHRGTTNSFQINGQTNLAALYSSEGSVMERHHLSQAMCILNTEGCDILESLPRRDYDRAIMMLRDNILATDLANYFKNFNEYKAISMDFQKQNRYHQTALNCMLMNAADLSDQLKDWGSVKNTAASVLTEFFKQGELEKMRGDMPAVIMDKDKCFIPDLEIQFIETICVPLFECLNRILPRTENFIEIFSNHIKRWEASKPVFEEVPTAAGLSVLLSPELDTLIELNLIEMEKLEKERLEAEAAENAAEAEAVNQ